MALATKTDLSRSPVNYSDEYKKLQELRLKNTALTTTGASSFTSDSSGTTYSTVNGGEAGVLNALTTVIASSLFTAADWNSIQAEINKRIVKSALAPSNPESGNIWIDIN